MRPMMPPSPALWAPLAQAPARETVLDLLLYAGPMAKLVLVLLLGFSVGSWAVVLFKGVWTRRYRNEDRSFLKLFRGSRKLEAVVDLARPLEYSPLAAVFRSGVEELSEGKEGEGAAEDPRDLRDRVERSLRATAQIEAERLESYLQFLATTGSATPFIGLFGTVWGIMDAFRSIGLAGSASLATVAPGISEALITTAAGLFAAIPAVVAYNYFLAQVRAEQQKIDGFVGEFLRIAERHFL